MEKDKHQEEIIGIQNNYKDKVNFQLKENQIEIETLKSSLEHLNAELDKAKFSNQQTSSKEDAWSLNGKLQKHSSCSV